MFRFSKYCHGPKLRSEVLLEFSFERIPESGDRQWDLKKRCTE